MPTQKILLPIFLLSFALCGALAFQTVETINQKNSYLDIKKQQEKPLENLEKIKAQINALATGTLKLSEQGNSNAQYVVNKLKSMGITINDQPEHSTPNTP